MFVFANVSLEQIAKQEFKHLAIISVVPGIELSFYRLAHFLASILVSKDFTLVLNPFRLTIA